jgi:hypothetical protein
MVKARTYYETGLLDEIELALRTGDDHGLAICERLRGLTCLPPDKRVRQRLHKQLWQAILEPAR